MKKIIRLTESELQNIVKSSVRRILKEDVLGNDWNVSDNESVYNNYEPFEDQERHEQEDEFRDNFDWGAQGEHNIDPTQYDDYDQISGSENYMNYEDYDPIEEDPESYMNYDDHDPTDNELYLYGQW
jgi:hypothetical protein